MKLILQQDSENTIVDKKLSLELIRVSLTILFFCLGIAYTTLVNAHPAVFIKLIAQEALPSEPGTKTYQQIKGVDRKQEPVTFGVPLHSDSNLFLLEQIALIGSDNFQFRALSNYPDGKIKWLLVDTLVDVKANGTLESMFLTIGTSILSEKKLAKESVDTITVDTGPAQFSFRKKGFNLFDKVIVNGKELVASSTTSGIILTGEDRITYHSNHDQKANVSIEENGPIRCVVLVQGGLVSQQGNSNLGYTLRMHFYKGKQRVRMLFTLRNASKKQLSNVTFRSLELVLQTKLKQASYKVATHEGEYQGAPLNTNAKMQVFQGENSFPTIRENGFTQEVWPTGISGYTVSLDGKTIQRGTREQYIPLFYTQLHQGSGAAITFGTRFAAGYWPQGLGASGTGTVRIGLFPTGNDKPYVIRFNSHVTRESMFHFADKAVLPRTPFFKFQYPVVIHPIEVDWFNQIEIWDERLVSFQEEADYNKTMKFPYNSHEQSTQKRFPQFAVVRHRDWSSARRPTEYSPAAFALFNHLRQHNKHSGTYYLMAEQMLQYNADLSAYHSDDYNVARVRDEVPGLSDTKDSFKGYEVLPNADKLPKTPSLWTASHRYASLFPKWYYLTGNARFRDVYLDWGEYQQTRNSNNKPSHLAHNLRNQSNLFVFTRNPLYQKRAWELLKKEVVDKRPDQKEKYGLDRLRGFYIGSNQANSKDRKVNIFEQGGSLLRAAVMFEGKVAANDEQANHARDLIDGLSRFVSDQAFQVYGSSIGEFGFPFSMFIDKKIGDVRNSPNWNKGLEEAYLAVHYAYIMSHNPSYLKQGEQLLRLTATNPLWEKNFGDHPSRQKLQYLIENPLLFSTWRTLPIQVDSHQDGRYRLSWLSPYNATNFWFKMSTKQIVPSLGYNPRTGTFKFAPAKYTPFFAATYIKMKPQIVDPGLYQAMFVTPPEKNKKYYFAARFLSNDPRRAPVITSGKEIPVPQENSTSKEIPTSQDSLLPDANTEQDPDPAQEAPSKGTQGCGCSVGSKPSSLWLLVTIGLLGLVQKKSRRNKEKKREEFTRQVSQV